jgi:hypothetical protein
VRASLVGDVLFSFRETSTRRLRKSYEQGEILISDKVTARREPGNLYRATALVELSTQDQIYSGNLGWQFVYKDKDKFVSLNADDYDMALINSSQRWQKKYYHQGIIGGNIDFKMLTQAKIAPKISLLYKFPIAGQRSEVFHCLNFLVGCNF